MRGYLQGIIGQRIMFRQAGVVRGQATMHCDLSMHGYLRASYIRRACS